MTRLLSTARWDFQLQVRNGFYYAAAVVVALNVIIVNQLPEASVGWLLPVILFENVVINAFYFMGGLVLLEKREGTLEVQVITPLRTGEYLTAKVITLAALSVVEGLVIVVFTFGLRINPLGLIFGMLALASLLTLVGFLVVARYDSINEYLFPSFLITAVLSLPLVFYFGAWQGPLVYAHPMQAPLVLLQAAFQPRLLWEWVYGLAYSALWVALAYRACARSFYRFVTTREGVRS